MVNHLCRHGLVEPTSTRKRGHGSARHYLFGDVVALRLVARLSAAGISVLRLKTALQRLRTLHPQITLNSLPKGHLVTDGKDLFLRAADSSLERALDGQLAFAFVVELEQLRKEVIQAIEATG